MTNFNRRQRFAKWIRDRREELDLTEEEFADLLGLSVAIILMWEVGGIDWELLPKEDKHNIESLCGEYRNEESEDAYLNQDFRKGAGTAFADEIEKEVERFSSEEEGTFKETERYSYYPDPFNENNADGIEEICSRCRTPILISNEGLCPNPYCRKRADPSQ